MIDAINSFGDLKGLVLDLRNNPGGLLSQAVEVCDHLLTKGQTIVSQRGRAYPDQNYTATHGNDGKTFPIVVLVNRNTASAAEIVSGALQDHDRALIVGETTFGKGLVQTVYNLSENTGLALTTYHYYTPSGPPHPAQLHRRLALRLLLQPCRRPALQLHQSRSQADRLRPHRLRRRRHHARREDRDPTDQSLPGRAALQGCVLPLRARTISPTHTVDKNFQVDDAVLTDFKKYLTGQNIPWTENDINGVTDWLKVSIKEKIVTSQFGQLQGLRTLADWDPEIQKALTFLPEAQALEDNAHKVLAQKAEARNNSGAEGVPVQP